MHAYGLPVARTKTLQFEDMKVLAVERFDHRWWTAPDYKSWLIRLPQEDMCQATGTPRGRGGIWMRGTAPKRFGFMLADPLSRSR